MSMNFFCDIHRKEISQICVDKQCKQRGIVMCTICQQIDHFSHKYIGISDLFKFLNGKLGEGQLLSANHIQQKEDLKQLITQIKILEKQIEKEEEELIDLSLYVYLNNFSEKDDKNTQKLKDLNIKNMKDLMKDIFKYIDIQEFEIVQKLSPTIVAQQEKYLKLIQDSTQVLEDIIQKFSNKQQIIDVIVENNEIVEFKNLLKTPSNHSESIISVAFSLDSKMIASGAKGQIKLWSAPPIITLQQSYQTEGLVLTLAFSNDDKILASGNSQGNIQLWDMTNRNNVNSIKQLKLNSGEINRIAFSNNDQFIASCSDDGKVILWKYQNNENSESILQEEQDSINGLSISNNNLHIAVITGKGNIKIFDCNSQKLVFTDNSVHQRGGSVQFSKDGKYLASCGKESYIVIWKIQNILVGDIQLFKQIKLPRQKDQLIWTVVFASNSQNLIVLDSISNQIYICSVEKDIFEKKIEVTDLNVQRKYQILDISSNMQHIALSDHKLNLITISQQK